MSRRVVAHGERQAAWRLTQVLLLGAFALGAHGAWDLFASGDETSGATTTTTAPVDDGEPDGGSSTTPSTTSTPATSTLEPARSFTLVATGDLLIHEFVADRAADYGGDGTWDFGPMFRRVRPILGGADVAIVLAVIPSVFETAFAALRRGGRLVCVGLPPETEGPMALPIFPTVLKGISVIGSIVGTRQDLTEVFELHARGRTRVIADTRKLDEVNEAIDDVLAGRAPARIVFEF